MPNLITEVVAPGIILYSEPFGVRRLNFYALEGEDGLTLFDAGVPGSVVTRLENGDLALAIRRLIISHADADHLGDGAAVQARFPNVQIECHAADRGMIEDHDVLVRLRYDQARAHWNYGYSPEVLQALRGACGDNFACTGTLADGQRLQIGRRSWEVLHVPGHSAGHLALWSADDGILLLGDAVLGFGPPLYAGGGASMPPTHESVTPYLTTIDRLGALPVRLALTGHWQPLDAVGFAALLADSRRCVAEDLACVENACRAQPRAFADLIAALADQRRTWDRADDIHYHYALGGYLDYLTQQGRLIEGADGRYHV